MKHFDDDMDELFNKAGRQYPLKTEPKDWDSVYSALHPGDGVAASAPPKKSNYRRFLPLLLLLLIPAVYVMIERETDSSVNMLSEESIKSESIKSENIKSENIKSENIRSNNNQLKTNQSDNISENNRSNNNQSTDNKSEINQSENNQSENIQSENIQSENIRSEDIQTKNNQLINKAVTKTDHTQLTISQSSTVASVRKAEDRLSLYNNLPPLFAEPATLTRPSESIGMNGKPGQLAGNNESASVPSIDKKKPSDKKGFYYGITAAPDVSMIKGQEIKRAGYTVGIIGGYQVTPRWSFEAGVLWSRKKYFTDGKYFSKAGAQIPASVDIYWINGGCNMFEFPLLVRYDFSPKKNTFFGSLGVTSYMMKTEQYAYGADAGSGYYESSRSYDWSGDHLFSNLQLSAGYKFSLSPKMNMRIEPYLKAPLKKIGIGKMPITSAGLSFGITRDFR